MPRVSWPAGDIVSRVATAFIDTVLDFNQAGDSPGSDLTRYRAASKRGSI